jgi:hypothetical protein
MDPQLQRAWTALSRTAAQRRRELQAGLLEAIQEPQRLERMMQTPARRVILDAIFWQMPRRIQRDYARALAASVRWHITGRPDGEHDVYQLDLDEGRCRIVRGPGDRDPRLTVTVDGVEFVRLATGAANPIQAYLSGRVGLAGDLRLATKLASLFRMPGSGI